MTKIRSILAATDFSPRSATAGERGVQLAAARGASLCLLHAFDVSARHSFLGNPAQRAMPYPTGDVLVVP